MAQATLIPATDVSLQSKAGPLFTDGFKNEVLSEMTEERLREVFRRGSRSVRAAIQAEYNRRCWNKDRVELASTATVQDADVELREDVIDALVKKGIARAVAADRTNTTQNNCQWLTPTEHSKKTMMERWHDKPTLKTL